MTYHKFSNEMKCHYCGQKATKPKICPKCHSENLNERGVGVEQIHEEVSRIFPEAEVDRMDVDSMRKKFAYEKPVSYTHLVVYKRQVFFKIRKRNVFKIKTQHHRRF